MNIVAERAVTDVVDPGNFAQQFHTLCRRLIASRQAVEARHHQHIAFDELA
jgi:hypothetical protein